MKVYLDVVPNVLAQWLFLFLLIAIFLLPGLLFSMLAVKHKEKGWIYFILGLVIMIIGFNVGHFIESILKANIFAADYIKYLGLIRFIIAFLSCWVCYKFLQRRFRANT